MPIPLQAACLRSVLPLPSRLSLPSKASSPLPLSLPLPRIKADGGLLPIPISISGLAQSPMEAAVPAHQGGIASSCFPSLAWANVFYAKGGHYNVQVVVGDDEPEEVLLRRFKREVLRAGVIQECKRRRWFENTHEKKKRKARECAARNRKRRYQPKLRTQDNQEASIDKKQDEEEDNWEIPEGEIPYCDRMP